MGVYEGTSMTEREKKRARLKILLDASILYRDVSNIKEKETAFNKYIRKRGISEKFYFNEVRDIWKVKKEDI
jgi:hypothetical protein